MTPTPTRKTLATTVALVLAAAALPPVAGALAAPDRAFTLAVAPGGAAATGGADAPVPLDRLLAIMENSCAGDATSWCKQCASLAREFCGDCLSRSFECAVGTVSAVAGYCRCGAECWGCTKTGVEAIDPSPPRVA